MKPYQADTIYHVNMLTIKKGSFALVHARDKFCVSYCALIFAL